MVEIVDFEWEGKSLPQHFREIELSIPVLSRGLRTDLVKKFHEEVKEGTPPEELKQSIMYDINDTSGLNGVYIGSVYTNKIYATHVEYGTGIYGPSGRPIEPKKADGVLAWVDPHTGEQVFARSTKGQRPQYMFYTAELLMRTRLVQQGVAEARLRRWAWLHTNG